MKKEVGIDNPKYQKFERVFKYAMDKTKAELDQSVEGLYHNLNTLD